MSTTRWTFLLHPSRFGHLILLRACSAPQPMMQTLPPVPTIALSLSRFLGGHVPLIDHNHLRMYECLSSPDKELICQHVFSPRSCILHLSSRTCRCCSALVFSSVSSAKRTFGLMPLSTLLLLLGPLHFVVAQNSTFSCGFSLCCWSC